MRKLLFLIIGMFFMISLIGFIEATNYTSSGVTVFTNDTIRQGEHGATINFTANFNITGLRKNVQSNATQCYIRTAWDGANLSTASYVGDWCNFTVPFAVNSSWAKYFILENSNGSYYMRTYNNTGPPSIPILNNNMWWIGGQSHQGAVGESGNIEGFLQVAFNNNSAVGAPIVVLNSPANNSQITNATAQYNSTISNNTFSLVNATLYIWYLNGSLFNTSTNTITGSVNTTLWNMTLNSLGTYLWNARGCQGDGLSGNCSFASNNFTVRYNIVTTNSMYFNVSSSETSTEEFRVNITSNGTTPINAFLIYNTTITSATITNTNGNNYNISSTIDVPLGVANNTFYFNFSMNGQEGTSDMFGQNVSATYFTNCNATYTDDFLNITFKDEVTDGYINGSISSSTFYYWLGTGNVYKSYTYSNTTNLYSRTFCASPTTSTFKVNESISYKQGTAYPQRTYTQSTAQSYTSSVTELPLYLLDSASGLYVTFQVVNTAEQVLSGVASNITRSGNLIAGGLTGSDGGITYWLNPDHTYTASFLKNPYPLFTATQQFTQTSYTIVLGSSASANTSDYQAGINYTIQPSITYLQNDTIYVFNFSITSTFWSLESYGFNITNGSGVFIGSAVGSVSGGGLTSLSVNTSGNQSLIMNYYWTINSTNTTASRNWLVIDTSQNTFSIKRMVDDFISYVGSGLFGLGSFGIGIICFIIIIGTTGVLKMKVGISNTATILGVMWALVALFDVTFGLIPNPVGAIDNFPTILMGLIFAGVMFREVYT